MSIKQEIPPLPGKLLGTYPQLQPGLFMQRIPIFAGRINASLLLSIADLAVKYTPGTPLHFTTRENIELHNIPENKLKQIHKEISKLGINTFGAGGDSMRNMIICPCCRFGSENYDPYPLARSIKEILENSELLKQLPRKFKFSFAGCTKPKSKPFASDLAFILISPDKVKVVGAGSLGASPSLAIVLFEELAIDQASALALATLRLFVEHGDRENRKKARLRHIRQRLGDKHFCLLLKDYFQQALEQVGSIPVNVNTGLADFRKIATIQTIGGDINPEQIIELCNCVKDLNAYLQINIHQGIEIYAQKKIALPEILKPFIDLPVIISCPGNTTCKNGLVNSPAHTKNLYQQIGKQPNLKGKIIAISGCHNNCMGSCIADIGLIGRLKSTNDGKYQTYTEYIGGDNGNSEKLAERKGIILAYDIVNHIKTKA